MTSKPLSSLVDLDVTRSQLAAICESSNDNPYERRSSKTMKYAPDYPERFASIGEARGWLQAFTGWYNHEHRHSGIGLHAPASVHYGTATIIHDQRQAVLDAAYAAHPERFNKRPQPPQLPEKVTINDPSRQNTRTSQVTKPRHVSLDFDTLSCRR